MAFKPVEKDRAYIYNSLISKKDLNEMARGWNAHESLLLELVSRCTPSQLVPPSAREFLPTTSRTLNNKPKEEQTLPPGVQARTSGDAVWFAFIKFILSFTNKQTSVAQLTLMQNAIICQQLGTVVKFVIDAMVPFSAVQGITSTTLVPETDYWIKKTLPAQGSKSATTYDFKVDGKIEQHTSASSTIVSGEPTFSTRKEAAMKIDKIRASKKLAVVIVQASALATLFPTKKSRTEQDRVVTINHTGVYIDGMIDDNHVSLKLKFADSGPKTDYRFIIEPCANFKGKLLMTGLTQLGRCFTGTGTGSGTLGVELTFYGDSGDYFYMQMMVPFSQIAAGSVYIPMASVEYDTAQASPWKQTIGDEAIVDPVYGAPNTSSAVDDESEPEEAAAYVPAAVRVYPQPDAIPSEIDFGDSDDYDFSGR